MILIKKYSNRRLYDTSSSAYVNLEQLGDLIRAGEQLQVVDAKTEEDLTRQVLLQILIELPGTLDVVPIALLHRLIRSTGAEPLHPLLAEQLKAGLHLLESQLAAFEAQFGWPTPPRSAARPAPAPPPSEPDAATQQSAAPPPDPELEALRRKLAALEARLGEPRP
jgi:polyhydroxyalkanoate synthesis repressor PhaR